MNFTTADLFSPSGSLPGGFEYRPDFIAADEEAALVAAMATLDFAPYEFRGVEARRRVVAYGYHHDYRTRRIEQAAQIPTFLSELRSKAAAFAQRPADEFKQVLVSEYSPGTPIGWHRDREHYGIIVGVSLLSPATLRFRKKLGERWLRQAQIVEPRSAYVLSGDARSLWEHSIPAVAAPRYSVTFRTMIKS